MTNSSPDGDSDAERSPHLQALEARLSALRPREDRLDRERLMYLAGQASAQMVARTPAAAATRWAWPASIGAVAGAAATILAMAMFAPAGPPQEFRGVANKPQPSTPSPAANETRPLLANDPWNSDEFHAASSLDGRLHPAAIRQSPLDRWLDSGRQVDFGDVSATTDQNAMPAERPLTSRSYESALQQPSEVNFTT